MVFQHPETTFDPLWTIQKSLSEPYRLQGISPAVEMLEVALNRVGIMPSILKRRPCQLSGGELQRIAIARIMALSPGVVILDEPTGMLDALTQAGIMGLLKRIQAETGICYLLITHDSALAARFCDRVRRLEGGRLIA
jgi:peptide/nickel transport system ATP-binding protein